MKIIPDKKAIGQMIDKKLSYNIPVKVNNQDCFPNDPGSDSEGDDYSFGFSFDVINIDNQVAAKESFNAPPLEVTKETSMQEYDIDASQFFNGNLLSLALQCQNNTDCGKTIQFQGRVNLNGGALGIPDLQVRDMEPILDDHLLIQTDNQIHMITTETPHQLMATVDLDNGGNLECHAIAVEATGLYAASVCADDTQTNALGSIILTTFQSSDPVVFARVTTDIINVKKAIII